jgi:hypothetical protein
MEGWPVFASGRYASRYTYMYSSIKIMMTSTKRVFQVKELNEIESRPAKKLSPMKQKKIWHAAR